MNSRPSTFWDVVFWVVFGLWFSSFGIWCAIRQKLPVRSGQSYQKIITPEAEPIFFWLVVLFCLGVGLFSHYRAVDEFQRWRRARRRAQQAKNDAKPEGHSPFR